MIRQLFAVAAVVALHATPLAAQSPHPDSARIITSDVATFWQAYDQLKPGSSRQDSIAVFASQYFAKGSAGLPVFIQRRLEKPENLLFGLGKLPRYMAAVRAATLSVHAREPVIRAALRRVEEIYPAANHPDIYFVIAGFISQGTVFGDDMFIAAEMVSADSTTPLQELPPFLRDVDLTQRGLPCILVHELFHYQQKYPRNRTLLAQALTEGVADFLTEHAIGCVPTARATYEWGNAHEAELWHLFQSEMAGEDYTKWLYNGSRVTDRPSQLGYWMGYRIARAYFQNARDKRKAISDMLEIQDFGAFLDASGYAATIGKSGVR